MTDFFAGDSRTNRERMLAGDWYVADDPENARRSQRAMQLLDMFQRAAAIDEVEAVQVLRGLLGSLGAGSFVKAPLAVDYGENIRIGERTFINANLTALDVAPITIGSDCQIGPNVQLLTPTHPLDSDLRRGKLERGSPISIGNNVWLAGGVIVLPGVTIGDNSVVGAGTVVTRDVPANVVVVGNPARIVRTLA